MENFLRQQSSVTWGFACTKSLRLKVCPHLIRIVIFVQIIYCSNYCTNFLLIALYFTKISLIACFVVLRPGSHNQVFCTIFLH